MLWVYYEIYTYSRKYKKKTLEELQKEISESINELEKEEDLNNSIDKYQQLMKLNNFIENKFREKAKSITSKTSDILKKILKKID